MDSYILINSNRVPLSLSLILSVYSYILYLDWRKATTIPIHVALSATEVVCIRWYVSHHWFSPRH